MSTNIERILEIANVIRQSTISNKEEFFGTRYKVFAQKYPHLFKQICTAETFDMDNLTTMLKMLHDIETKKKVL